MNLIHSVVKQITETIRQRSRQSRRRYLDGLEACAQQHPPRQSLSCSNLAHSFAASPQPEKDLLFRSRGESGGKNIGIITAYNDMLSAHKPYEDYPKQLRRYFFELGASCQVAGGVPAMCDGVTQGQPGMELSLFSRDVIAMSTAVSLSHNTFDAAIGLAICDKIVPGMLMGALSFGHLPFMFIPAGPMPSGISNAEKARTRQKFAEGKADEDELLQVEMAAYHSEGTCTFYGTANSNQLLMECMGLMLPGAAFVQPTDPLRTAFNKAACVQLIGQLEQGPRVSLADIVSEETVVNGIVSLLASGGSTNHTMHLVAIAAQAGIQINWDDFQALSEIVPLIARVYPNGEADINEFHQAGGTAFLIDTLLNAGLFHEKVNTVLGTGLEQYTKIPALVNGVPDNKSTLDWNAIKHESKDENVLVSCDKAFRKEAGLKLMCGNLGRAIVKTSALKDEAFSLTAPCCVFESQKALKEAFDRDELNKDFIAVVRYQGARANGMPELHQLTPVLSVLQNRGHKVALITDGRMSGASGAVPAAIHLYPEAQAGGLLSVVRDGDQIVFDCGDGKLELLVSKEELEKREPERLELTETEFGMGREIFSIFRKSVSHPEQGAIVSIKS